MKLKLLTDEAGKIVATHVSTPTLPLPPPSRPSTTLLQPSKGQVLHEVEVPPELAHHLLGNTLSKEIFKWKVHGQGKTAKLVKI